MPGLFDRVEHAAWEVVGEKPRNVLKEFPDSVSSLRISTPKLPKALDCTLQFASGASLPKHTRVALLSLVKKNMQDIYNQSSWGWNEKKKLRELIHADARYLLLKHGERVIAFLHFRFEVVNKRCVVYCYEIQVEADMVGLGIGKRLMVLLEILARKFAMDKVMLTVLDQNPGAKHFYLKMGYSVDEDDYCSEEDGEERGDSYEILSKSFARPV